MHHGVLFSYNNPFEFQLVQNHALYRSFSLAHWIFEHGGKSCQLRVLYVLVQQLK